MNNYENQREIIDAILNNNDNIAIDIDTNKITACRSLACSKCLFFNEHNGCYRNTIKWLVEEYKEPEIDWSKVSVDTPVLVSNDGTVWARRYFAKATNSNSIWVFSDGATSWSAGAYPIAHYKYAKLAEVSDE